MSCSYFIIQKASQFDRLHIQNTIHKETSQKKYFTLIFFRGLDLGRIRYGPHSVRFRADEVWAPFCKVQILYISKMLGLVNFLWSKEILQQYLQLKIKLLKNL